MLYATVRQRKIHVKNPVTVIQNGVGVDFLTLDMDDEWREMESIVCVFTLKYTGDGEEKETTKEMLHSFGTPVQVPWECLTETGLLSVSCTGYVGSEKVMTTMMPDSFWNVVQNGPVTGETPMEPTASLYDQVIAAAGAANTAASGAAAIASQLTADREAGVFNGADGITPTVTVGTVLTGATGAVAQVTQSGTATDVVLNFVLPRGAQGVQGPTGPMGAIGKTGPQGPAGPTGAQGPRGEKGEKGDTGPQGATGAQGPKGETGATGPRGEKGDTGLTGAQGPKGETGATGPKGEKGDTGPRGEKGEPGEAGPEGPAGPAGATGPKGEKGDTGPTGAQGAKGDTGATGPKGEKGDTGPQGPQGPRGETGSGFKVLGYYETVSALSAAVTVPQVGDAYGIGAAVPYDIYIYSPGGWVNNGALQGAKGDTGDTGPQGPQGEKGDTGPAGPAGAAGKDGTTFTPSVSASGDLSWSNDGGKSNPATVNIKGPKGDTGAAGAAGAKGEKGDTGPAGADGAKGEKGDTGPAGPAGAAGVAGKDGTTFTPSVSAAGDLSWSNDGGKSNPATVNIKGPKGDTGAAGAAGAKGEKGDTGPAGADGAKGEKGDTGATGAQGPKGETGATGPAGAGVKSMTYNSSTNKWTVALTDGTSLTVDGPAIPDVSGYMPKSGGTFTGAVAAASAATGSYYVRNIKFSTEAETPSVEGDICFKLA